MRFVSYQDCKKIATSMRTIYTAPSVEAAELALKDLDQHWGVQYPGVIDVWRRAWPEFIPFLDYPPELRRVVYTTNLIESINFQLRKITKTRGHFPSDEAAMKLLYLGLRNISSNRGGESGTGTHGSSQQYHEPDGPHHAGGAAGGRRSGGRRGPPSRRGRPGRGAGGAAARA